ncbi:hypothetical protein ACFQ64_14520 [Streptomyces sp. NPDC056460]|uniref:hypothetical protein n=1 Tax=Streptomyces sp. NPDC056460 TaxID=3345825 RepID=UPI0036BBB88E
MVKRHDREVRSAAELLEALGRQALHEVAGAVPEEAPNPEQASVAVTGGFIQPAARVSHSDPSARDLLDDLWHDEADRLGILDANGEFLLLATYPGSLTRGWIRVRDSIGGRLPSRIAAASGSREFIAIALDRTALCAVSTEEYEDWIVTRSFEGH